MKLVSLFLLVFAFITFEAQAQFNTQPFKAKAGLEFAKNQSGLSSEAKLYAILTVNTQAGDGGFTFDLSYNASTGEGKIWVYTFGDGETFVNVPVIRLFNNYTNVNTIFPGASEEFEMDDLDPEVYIEDEFNDSDVPSITLLSNSDFNLLTNKYPDSKLMLVMIRNNPYDEILIYEDPYWIYVFGTEDDEEQQIDGEETHVCFVHAVDNSVFCLDIMGMSVRPLNEVAKIYPNPVASELNFELQNLDCYNLELEIISITGVTITKMNYTSAENLSINLDNLSTGTYFVRLNCGARSYFGNFIKR